MNQAEMLQSMSTLELPKLRRSLLRWYQKHRRDLPWRRTREPYRIWISEIMLQQTRVDVVVPYYNRFVERFPDVVTLAHAPLEDVLHAWSGLGYYSRARNLYAAARRIRDQYAGVFPDTLEEVLKLPGVGRYTAGAILSIASDQRLPIVDGNVTRVFARLLAIEEDVHSTETQKQIWELASLWAKSRRAGDANQALMELGATICIKPAPLCDSCPLQSGCRARRYGRERELPRPRVRNPSSTVHLAAALIRDGGRLLLVQRRSGRLLRDWWEVPVCRLAAPAERNRARRQAGLFDSGTTVIESILEAMRSHLHVQIEKLELAGHVRHGILSHRLEVEVVTGKQRAETPPRRSQRRSASKHQQKRGGSLPRQSARAASVSPTTVSPGTATSLANLDLDDLEVRWVKGSECADLPISTLSRKVLRAAAASDSSWLQYLQQLHGDEGKPTTRKRRRDPAQ